MTTLTPGDPAPPFSLPDQSGRTVSLSDFAGRTLLVYFYPKADTPGCTTQSCEVRDAREDLTSLGVDVVGISVSPVDAQRAFDEKYELGFPLLSDPEHTVCDAWGTWGEKSLYGNTYLGVIRSSFLVGPDGLIREAWYKVAPKQTVPEAMKALRATPA
ncbi:MAG: thioredoxin-dependent thiol peroxidase [Actinomycetota bacterium]